MSVQILNAVYDEISNIDVLINGIRESLSPYDLRRFDKMFSEYTHEANNLLYRDAFLTDPGSVFFQLAIDDEHEVGFAIANDDDMLINVIPPYRRMGIGRMLLKRALRQCVNGCYTVEVLPSDELTAFLSKMSSEGFQYSETRDKFTLLFNSEDNREFSAVRGTDDIQYTNTGVRYVDYLNDAEFNSFTDLVRKYTLPFPYAFGKDLMYVYGKLNIFDEIEVPFGVLKIAIDDSRKCVTPQYTLINREYLNEADVCLALKMMAGRVKYVLTRYTEYSLNLFYAGDFAEYLKE